MKGTDGMLENTLNGHSIGYITMEENSWSRKHAPKNQMNFLSECLIHILPCRVRIIVENSIQKNSPLATNAKHRSYRCACKIKTNKIYSGFAYFISRNQKATTKKYSKANVKKLTKFIGIKMRSHLCACHKT